MVGMHGVALHSVSENLDLSSAAGWMFVDPPQALRGQLGNARLDVPVHPEGSS